MERPGGASSRCAGARGPAALRGGCRPMPSHTARAQGYAAALALSTAVLLRAHLTDEFLSLGKLVNVLVSATLTACYGYFAYFSPPPLFEGLGKMTA